MADKTTSQVQQNVSQAQQTMHEQATAGAAAVARLFEEQLARAAGLQAEFARAEKQGVDQALVAIDEMAKLTKAGLQWYVTMASQGRQMALDTVKRSTSFFVPVA